MNQISPQKYLKFVSILNYVFGALLLPFHIYIFSKAVVEPASISGYYFFDSPFWFILIFPVLRFIFASIVSICILISGYCILKRKNYIFSIVIASVSCVFVEYGIFLGIVTLIVMSQQEVKELYDMD